MGNLPQVLVVSSNPDTRRSLSRAVRDYKLYSVLSSGVRDAQGVLDREPIGLI